MKIYKYNPALLLTISLMLLCQIIKAQPNWSVAPPEYQYTMTVTGIGLFYCQETIDEEDMVAAFIGDECRGVQYFRTTVNDQKLAYLTVYDHIPAGSEITFKLYDASEDAVIDDVYKASFVENATFGNIETPYQFQTDFPLEELYLENTTLYDYSKMGDEVSQAITVNANGDMDAYSIQFVDDSLGVDNASFEVDGANLVLAQDVDFINKQSYQVHLIATTDAGCTIDEVFTIIVINTDLPPTGLDQSDLEINENEAVGSLVLTLIAIDESVNDVHVYELVDETGEWPDNQSFYIEGDQLLSSEVFDYETKNVYSIQIKITDRVGNTFVETLDINVLDVIEFDDLKASNLVTPNDDGYNDFLEIPNVHLFADYTLLIYNDIGNELFQVTSDYDNSWNGLTSRGVEMPSGTYYFLLRDNQNENNYFIGDIHLYRNNKF